MTPVMLQKAFLDGIDDDLAWRLASLSRNQFLQF
jgi:hypothetical protein